MLLYTFLCFNDLKYNVKLQVRNLQWIKEEKKGTYEQWNHRIRLTSCFLIYCLFVGGTIAWKLYSLSNVHKTFSHMVYSQLQQHLVTPPNRAEFTASTVSRSNTSHPPAVLKVLHVQVWPRCCRWLTAGLIFDEGLGTNQRLVSQSVWCREHPNLCYCYTSPSCPAIHRAEDRVLQSHSESFTKDRNTMKSE